MNVVNNEPENINSQDSALDILPDTDLGYGLKPLMLKDGTLICRFQDDLEIIVYNLHYDSKENIIAEFEINSPIGIPFIQRTKIDLLDHNARMRLALYSKRLAFGEQQNQLFQEAIEHTVKISLAHFEKYARPIVPDILNANMEPQSRNVSHLFEIDGLGKFIPEGHSSTIFSQGGSGKSLTADYLALIYSCGIPDSVFIPLGTGNVLILDWEADIETHRRYISAIKRDMATRHNTPLDEGIINYIQFSEPIIDHDEYIRQFISNNDIKLVIIDSQMASMAGAFSNLKEETLAGVYYNLLSSWKVTTLTIDHIAKQNMNSEIITTGAAFGTVVKYNRARSVFELKQTQEPGENSIELGLTQTKSNLGPKLPAFGIKINFINDQWGTLNRVHYEHLRLEDSPKLQKLRPQWQQVKEALLEMGTATIVQLSEQLEMSQSGVRAVLTRYTDLFVVVEKKREGNIWGVKDKVQQSM